MGEGDLHQALNVIAGDAAFEHSTQSCFGGKDTNVCDSRSLQGEREVAGRLLEKLRTFITQELDECERALLAALVAPGVALAQDEPDVLGFAGWLPTKLPDGLVRELERRHIRVEGLDPEPHRPVADVRGKPEGEGRR